MFSTLANFLLPVEDFQCASGHCIPQHKRCNGQVNCKDKSDELECKDMKCPESKSKCGTGNESKLMMVNSFLMLFIVRPSVIINSNNTEIKLNYH